MSELYRQYDERLWRPYHRRSLLFMPIGYDGITQSGLRVIADPRRPKRRGVVLNVNFCDFVEPGDSIIFLDGQYDELRTGSGEILGIMAEKAIIAVLDDDGIPRTIDTKEAIIL